jgi:hypothetical protein
VAGLIDTARGGELPGSEMALALGLRASGRRGGRAGPGAETAREPEGTLPPPAVKILEGPSAGPNNVLQEMCREER